MANKGLLLHARRWLVNAGVHATLSLGRLIGPNGTSAVGSLCAGLAGLLPNLRGQLRANWKAAGLQPADDVVDGYFRRLGCWAGWSAAVYSRGFVDSGIAAKITLDGSFAHVEAAVAKGKGVILACPHAFCHELAAAAINLRHPVVALVRESKSAAREAMKSRWYQATGMSIVKRPRRASLVADTMSAIRSLRSGAILGITPDVIVPPEKGVPVRLLGRRVVLSPGIITLSMRLGSPIVTPWGEWVHGRTSREDRLVLRFTPPLEFPARKHTEAEVQAGLQQWCQIYEDRFRRNPDYWMFWLDKNWTKVLSRSAN
jgi:KDO2-lipid IV(A) lauroyltransferase